MYVLHKKGRKGREEWVQHRCNILDYFYYFLIQRRMKKNPSQTEKWVHKLTKPTFMKFAPKRDF